MRWYIVIMLSTHFFIFRHLRIFAHQKDKIIRIQHEEYTQLLPVSYTHLTLPTNSRV